MHDIRAIRADAEAFEAALRRRAMSGYADLILELDGRRRALQGVVESLQSERKLIAGQIAELRRHDAPTDLREQRARDVNAEIVRHSANIEPVATELHQLLSELPNVLDPSVPDGADERANVVLKEHGNRRNFAFTPREHSDLGEALGQMDFATAAKIAGSRFTILRGALARLERALGQFMIDLHTEAHGYTELSVPLLVNDAAAYGTAQLPKFADDLFRTTDGRWLIPTAEVPLTNIVAGEIIPGAQLPIRLTALTECFRREAGSAGRDTRGMLRQHQFKKVELVSVTTPQDSDAEHERMTGCAEAVLERLEIPYRRMLLCAGDTGFGAAKTFDLEVWLPGQGAWREISSCSTMRAFQARRMNARYRLADGKTLAPVHTLNGSGVAVGRALIAVMENYQQADGSIAIPAVLQSYMGSERIQAPARRAP